MIRRRKFITLLGGAAAWPLAAHAQQRAMPVIGYLSGRTADSDASMLVSVRRGRGDVGYAEGRNVAIEYRFTDGYVFRRGWGSGGCLNPPWIVPSLRPVVRRRNVELEWTPKNETRKQGKQCLGRTMSTGNRLVSLKFSPTAAIYQQ